MPGPPTTPTERQMLARQRRLLEYLTDPGRFDPGGAGPQPLEELSGIDPYGLKVTGRLSLSKRFRKVESVMPQTLGLVDGRPPYAFPDFAHRYPPAETPSLAHARQFLRYLEEVWTSYEPDPTWLPDLALFELALAEVSADQIATPNDAPPPDKPAVRRARNLALLALAHDIRPVFEPGSDDVPVEHRAVRLAILRPAGERQPRVFELASEVFAFVEGLAEWRSCDTAENDAPMPIGALLSNGFLERSP